LIQEVLIPKRAAEIYDPARVTAVEENSIDAVFLGSSHVYYGVSPMEIYEATGITSYVLATNAQPVAASYYYLKDFYERQSPSVVFLDVGGFFRPPEHDTNKVAWKYVFDLQPFGHTEVELVKAYAQEVDLSAEQILSIVVPFYEYHTRWNSLTIADFLDYPKHMPFTAGYYLSGKIEGTSFTADYINKEADKLEEINTSYITVSQDGNRYEEIVTDTLFEEKVEEYNRNWLAQINELCQAHGSQLILTKIPVMQAPQDYISSWTDQNLEIITSIADEQGIPYLNLGYGEDFGLDFTRDTMDGGKHLNYHGAKKLSHALAEYLNVYFDISSEPAQQYDSALDVYKKVVEVVELQSETNFPRYLKRLSENLEKWDIIITAAADYSASLSAEAKKGLESLGCTMASDGKVFDCYVAIISDEAVTYEAISPRRIEYESEYNNQKVELFSSSWRTSSGASIKIDGIEYGYCGVGLNFVVIDRQTNLVVDSVAFNTHSAGAKASRNWSVMGKWREEYAKTIEAALTAQEE